MPIKPFSLAAFMLVVLSLLIETLSLITFILLALSLHIETVSAVPALYVIKPADVQGKSRFAHRKTVSYSSETVCRGYFISPKTAT